MSDRIFVLHLSIGSPINPISSASLMNRPAGLAVVAMVAMALAQVGARAEAGAKVVALPGAEDIFGDGAEVVVRQAAEDIFGEGS